MGLQVGIPVEPQGILRRRGRKALLSLVSVKAAALLSRSDAAAGMLEAAAPSQWPEISPLPKR